MSSNPQAPGSPAGRKSSKLTKTPGAPGKKKKNPHVFKSEGTNLSASGAYGDQLPMAGGRRRRRKSKRKSRKKSHKKKRKTKRRRKSRKKRTKRRRRR
jgi:hypothetical protein